MEAMVSSASPVCNLAILVSLSENLIDEMGSSSNAFCLETEELLMRAGNLSYASDFSLHARNLCSSGLESLGVEHFLCSMEKKGALRYWMHFDAYREFAVINIDDPDQQGGMQDVLHKALANISSEKQYQEKCLFLLIHALETGRESKSMDQTPDAERNHLLSKYQLTVSSVLMSSLPRHFPDVLHWYFKGRLEELSAMTAIDDGEFKVDDGMDLDFKSGEIDSDGTHPLENILEQQFCEECWRRYS